MNIAVLIGVGCLGTVFGMTLGRARSASVRCRNRCFEQAMPGIAAIRADIAALPLVLAGATQFEPAPTDRTDA